MLNPEILYFRDGVMSLVLIKFNGKSKQSRLIFHSVVLFKMFFLCVLSGYFSIINNTAYLLPRSSTEKRKTCLAAGQEPQR